LSETVLEQLGVVLKGGVQTIIKETYKNAHFIHCYAHQLNLIMEKAASQNPEVCIFF
jgi:hypothetical protein